MLLGCPLGRDLCCAGQSRQWGDGRAHWLLTSSYLRMHCRLLSTTRTGSFRRSRSSTLRASAGFTWPVKGPSTSIPLTPHYRKSTPGGPSSLALAGTSTSSTLTPGLSRQRSSRWDSRLLCRILADYFCDLSKIFLKYSRLLCRILANYFWEFAEIFLNYSRLLWGILADYFCVA